MNKQYTPQRENDTADYAYEQPSSGPGLGTLAAVLSAAALATPVGRPVRKLMGKADIGGFGAKGKEKFVDPLVNKVGGYMKDGALSRAVQEGRKAVAAQDGALVAGAPTDFGATWNNIVGTGKGAKAAGKSLWDDIRQGFGAASEPKQLNLNLGESQVLKPMGKSPITANAEAPGIITEPVSSITPVPSTLAEVLQSNAGARQTSASGEAYKTLLEGDPEVIYSRIRHIAGKHKDPKGIELALRGMITDHLANKPLRKGLRNGGIIGGGSANNMDPIELSLYSNYLAHRGVDGGSEEFKALLPQLLIDHKLSTTIAPKVKAPRKSRAKPKAAIAQTNE